MARFILHKNAYFKYIVYLGLLSILGLLFMSASLDSLNHILNFNGPAANGAFQLMNPLTRLANGEVLGKDFQFFHGSGVVLVHYPLFEIFGKGLFGAEMSRWFTSVILFFMSGLLLCFVWFGRINFQSISKSVLAFIVLFLITASLTEAILPSNSLLGVRTTIPIGIACVLLARPLFQNKRLQIFSHSISVYYVIIGLLLSLAVLCGTEHGIAATLSYLFSELIHKLYIEKRSDIKGELKSYFVNSSICILIGSLVLFILASIISAGAPLKLLKYNLLTVPEEQFWYFGAYPQGFLQSHVLFKQLADPTLVSFYFLAALSICLIVLSWKFSLISTRQKVAILYLSIYALLTLGSFAGYFSPSAQLAGAIRVLIAIDVLIIITLIAKSLKSKNRYAHYAALTVILILLLQPTVLIKNKVQTYPVKEHTVNTFENIRGDHSSLIGPQWQSRIDKFSPYLNEAKLRDSKYTVWSTYSSLYEQKIGTIQPSTDGCDYIIHCLGPEMTNSYTQDFIQLEPPLASTLRPSYFGFEEWLWARHADFYRHLIANYEIADTNDTHILWKKQDMNHKSSAPLQKPLNIKENTIELPSSSIAGSQVIQVTVKYRTDKYLSKLPAINKLPRYILHPINTHSRIGISLPQKESSWKFIIVLDKDNSKKQELKWAAEGLVPAHMNIDSAMYTPIYTDKKETELFTEQSVFYAQH